MPSGPLVSTFEVFQQWQHKSPCGRLALSRSSCERHYSQLFDSPRPAVIFYSRKHSITSSISRSMIFLCRGKLHISHCNAADQVKTCRCLMSILAKSWVKIRPVSVIPWLSLSCPVSARSCWSLPFCSSGTVPAGDCCFPVPLPLEVLTVWECLVCSS